MRTFTARHPGICRTCGDRFDVSDHIGYDSSDTIVCADCLRDDHRATQRPVQVCPACFTEHAGECM